MKKILYIFFALSFIATTDVFAENTNADIKSRLKIADESTAEPYFEKGNALYNKSDFAGAANVYEGILNSGYISPELFYNLGNAYFRLSNLPQALLYYEKAAKLDPNDEDTEYNKAFVNNLITDKIEKKPVLFIWEWLEAFRNMFSSGGWATLIIIFFWLGFASLAVYFIIRYTLWRKVSFIAALGFFALTLFSIYFANNKYNHENSTDTAIVFSPRIDIRHSPEEEGKIYLTLHEGTKVYIEDEVNGWYKIRLTDGRIGWIKENSVKVI
jgi:tetratricopeptide (TPR) repeat protein